jgi:hypothetical protein
MGDSKKLKESASKGLAGAGGGTLLVLLANNLSKDNPWRSWLALVAPSATIGITFVYRWVREYYADLEVQRLYRETKKTCDEAEKNPDATPEHKAVMKQAREMVERQVVERSLQRLFAIGLGEMISSSQAGGVLARISPGDTRRMSGTKMELESGAVKVRQSESVAAYVWAEGSMPSERKMAPVLASEASQVRKGRTGRKAGHLQYPHVEKIAHSG